MKVDIEKLKALAEAAQKGPWVSAGNWVSTLRGNSVADCPRGDEDFIAAAHPAAVLELSADVEENRNEREVVCANYEQLKAESETLRKDAERYRWLRDGASVILSKEVGFIAESGVKIYSTMPSQRELNSAIDAAMAQDQQP